MLEQAAKPAADAGVHLSAITVTMSAPEAATEPKQGPELICLFWLVALVGGFSLHGRGWCPKPRRLTEKQLLGKTTTN